MVCYYDSSILLAAILEQGPLDLIPSLWEPTEIRLSSVLSKIECMIGVRRAGMLQKLAPDGPWCTERVRLLDSYLDELECKRIDEDIHDIIRKTPSLANCRSLDAIHVATALYFEPHLDEEIQIVTLDGRMRQTAIDAGFAVLPT
jgi:hypothetical protein